MHEDKKIEIKVYRTVHWHNALSIWSIELYNEYKNYFTLNLAFTYSLNFSF